MATKITSKGQVTLPKKVRDDLGLRPGDEIEFVLEGTSYRVRKVLRENPFAKWVGYLRREGIGEELRGKTSDELVDEMRGERLDNGD